jgi:LysM repeat protein
MERVKDFLTMIRAFTESVKAMGLARKTITASFTTLSLATGAWATDYLVKSGDTLSSIAHQTLPGRVWARDGSLAQLAANNPQITDLNVIYPGQKIKIPSVAQDPVQESRFPAAENEPLASIETKPAEAFGFFSVDSGFFSTKIAATERSNGSTASLLTKSNVQEIFSYSQHWNNDFETSVYFGFENLNISSPPTGGSIDDPSPTLHHFGVTGVWKPSSKSKVGFSLGMDQQPFLIGISASTIKLDLLYVPTFKISYGHDLYQNGPFTLAALVGTGVSAPETRSNYQSRWNPDYEARVYLIQQAFAWMNVETGAVWNEWKQNTSITEQDQTDLGVYLKLSFPLGGNFK